jgi:hypothetical protein
VLVALPAAALVADSIIGSTSSKKKDMAGFEPTMSSQRVAPVAAMVVSSRT